MKLRIIKRIATENIQYLWELAKQKWIHLSININLLEKNLDDNDKVADLHAKAAELHPILGRYFWRIAEVVTVCFILWALMYGFVWKAPLQFPNNSLVSIEQGAHLGEVAQNF